jgi:threonine dehydrogenase-like Zn-dependent dehydrogenase
LRLYGKNDLRLETFDLPKIKEDEALVKIVTDSLCMSSYRAAVKGPGHRRVPDDVASAPIVLGHEFCGEMIEVGARLKSRFKQGQRFVMQTGMRGTMGAIGYSYRFIGGDMTYGVIPGSVFARGQVLPYEGDAFFYGSLVEPLSYVIGAAHANYHTIFGEYGHIMEIVAGGKTAALAALGRTGLALLDYLVHRDHHPELIVATDIDERRIERAARILPPEEAAKNGVKLIYLNTGALEDPAAELKRLTNGTGFDDVFVLAPVSQIVEQGDAILGYDGCLNFFAGPGDEQFTAGFNFYHVRYNATHIASAGGGATNDMIEALELATLKRTNPAILVTHIGGLDSARGATLRLPSLPGGKKVIYNHLSLPLTAIDDFAEKGRRDPLFAGLARLCAKTGGLWNAEAERFLLGNAKPLNADTYAP